jgi:hypothetical protein
LKYFDEYRAMGDSLLSVYEVYFRALPISAIFRKEHFNAFHLCKRVEDMDLTLIDFRWTTRKEYEELFQLTFDRGRVEFFLHVQNQIVTRDLFPSAPPYECDRIIRSLSGTVVLTERHFIDHARAVSAESYRTGNYSESYSRAVTFDRIGMWIFLSHAARDFDSVFHRFNPYLTGIPESKSIAQEFVQRHRNDERFFTMLRRCT